MAVSLNKATGTLDDNSYATLAEALLYFETTLPADETAWLDLSDALKDRYLVWGSRVLDDSFDWLGRRTNEGNGQTAGQAMEWPRRRVARDGWKAFSKTMSPFDISARFQRLGIPLGFRDAFDLTSLDELDTTIVPLPVVHAACQMAFDLSVKDRTADSTLNSLKSVSTGDERVVWREGNVPMSQGTISSKVFDLIRIYGIYKPSLNSEGTGATTGRMSRA